MTYLLLLKKYWKETLGVALLIVIALLLLNISRLNNSVEKAKLDTKIVKLELKTAMKHIADYERDLQTLKSDLELCFQDNTDIQSFYEELLDDKKETCKSIAKTCTVINNTDCGDGESTEAFTKKYNESIRRYNESITD